MAIPLISGLITAGKWAVSANSFLQGARNNMANHIPSTHTFGTHWQKKAKTLEDETLVTDGNKAAEKLSQIFAIISIADTNGLNFHCSGTLEIETQSYIRPLRGITKKITGVETAWSDDIINLDGLAQYIEIFSRRCLLGEKDAKQLTTAINAAIIGLNTLKQRYDGQGAKKKIVEDLQTALQKCQNPINENTTSVTSKGYWQILHDKLLANPLGAKETAIIASSYLAVGKETIIDTLAKKQPNLSLFITSAEKLKLPRKEIALLVTRILHQLKTAPEPMKKIFVQLKKVPMFFPSKAKTQIQSLFEKCKLLTPPKPKSTGLITDWIMPLRPKK